MTLCAKCVQNKADCKRIGAEETTFIGLNHSSLSVLLTGQADDKGVNETVKTSEDE